MLQNERLCHNMIHEHLHTFDMNRNGNHFQCLKPPLVPKKETAHNCRQNPFQNISPRRWCQFSLALALRADRALEIHWRSAPPLAERSRTANRNRALNLSPVSWTASSSVDGILSPDVAPLDFISSRWSGSNSSNKAFSSSPPAMSSRCMLCPVPPADHPQSSCRRTRSLSGCMKWASCSRCLHIPDHPSLQMHLVLPPPHGPHPPRSQTNQVPLCKSFDRWTRAFAVWFHWQKTPRLAMPSRPSRNTERTSVWQIWLTKRPATGYML